MSASRTLPKKHNPLVVPDATPDYEDLLSRRRLGKTTLSVKPGQIGTSNATKPENLGVFEYAHLRAPIPKDLKGSEIFSLNAAQQTQSTYFLMRRSKDGYISATGMFKIAFPWAKHAEEKREREYLKSRPETSEDEIAGNVWISPELALELGKEYKMFDWVRALLDPADIVQKPNTPEKNISSPPKFDASSTDAKESETPSSTATRPRTRRSASPSKPAAIAGRKIAQPRKSRRAQKEASVASVAANESLQNTLDAAASNAGSSIDERQEESAQVNGEHAGKDSEDTEERIIPVKKASEKVKASVESTTNNDVGKEMSSAKFSVDMPAGAPPVPDDPDEMLSKAKEMVEEATKVNAEASGKSGKSSRQANKRKAAEDEDTEDADGEGQQPKRAKVLENTLRRERVRNRALIGVTASLALAATIPYFF